MAHTKCEAGWYKEGCILNWFYVNLQSQKPEPQSMNWDAEVQLLRENYKCEQLCKCPSEELHQQLMQIGFDTELYLACKESSNHCIPYLVSLLSALCYPHIFVTILCHFCSDYMLELKFGIYYRAVEV